MQVLIVEEVDEQAIECDEIKLVAFRPTMRALYFKQDSRFEEAKKRLKDLGVTYELL
jgi:hypothetical protein